MPSSAGKKKIGYPIDDMPTTVVNHHFFDSKDALHHPFPPFFFNDTATTEIYTLSLHDALPIDPCPSATSTPSISMPRFSIRRRSSCPTRIDRKSTRLNSSHVAISYAVFCLKKKKKKMITNMKKKKKKAQKQR